MSEQMIKDKSREPESSIWPLSKKIKKEKKMS